MEVHPVQEVTVTEVRPDPRRLFLVVSGVRSRTGEPWTLVMERQNDYWISRRDMPGRFDADAAVLGHLFARKDGEDPLALLRRMNESVRLEYYRLLQEKMKAEQTRRGLVHELDRLKRELGELKGSDTRARRFTDEPKKPSHSRRRRSSR